MTALASGAHGLARAATLGAVAGMRSQLPLALLALRAQRQPAAQRVARYGPFPATPLRALASLAAVGELIGDKLPSTPSRLDPAPLAARFVLGGFAGGIVSADFGGSRIAGALCGAAGAGLGAFAGYHLRRRAGEASGFPDPLFGAVEDGIAIALGLWAITIHR
jgi:uncharacterized membrane protein